MNTNGVLEILDTMKSFPVASGKFEKFLEATGESLSCLSIYYSPLQAFGVVAEQQFKEASSVPGKSQEPGVTDSSHYQISCTMSAQLIEPGQGALEVQFTGALDGIACQVMVEHKAVRCRIKAMAAPARSRMRRFGKPLARLLAKKGMTLENFEVTS